MLKKLLKWLPAIFVAACNFYLSSQEHLEHMPGFWNADKVVHFSCFSGFSVSADLFSSRCPSPSSVSHPFLPLSDCSSGEFRNFFERFGGKALYFLAFLRYNK